ncbi:MAG TPA: FtsH protease activity modulator HflK [Rhizomicrobium sp.]|jgi:membrane protease subunit HflK|nr:FtsH protease activity modulator HflK [Rhizomicrobium sp.]
MPWTNQGGNGGAPGGGGRGPWGRGPGGVTPPDLEELLRRSQDRLRGLLPGGSGFGMSGLAVIALGIAIVWLASGIYIVNPDEQGVVLRFGKFTARTSPGINYHLPWPIEVAYTPKVTRENQINIGYHQNAALGDNAQTEDVPEESLMLTGDENIVDVNFTVFWVIKDASAYLFNVEDTQAAIKAVAESAMREVVGQNQIEPILTQDREPVQIRVRELMQQTLDSYGAGITITRVQMQKADPPAEVIDAYRDVQAARADQERARNEAEGYANKIIPEARGNAARIVQQAEAYRQQAIAEASGEAKHFLSVYEEYRKAPEITRKRMYLETMSNILGTTNKIIVDDNAKVIPYLPLPGLHDAQGNATVTTTEGPAASSGSGQ